MCVRVCEGEKDGGLGVGDRLNVLQKGADGLKQTGRGLKAGVKNDFGQKA